MKTILQVAQIGLALAGLAGFAGASKAQTSASATATVTAKLIQPISIVNTGNQGLSFGEMILPTANTTATVSASAAGTGTGPAFLASGGAPQAAKFTVTGDAAQTFNTSISATALSGPGSSTLVLTPSSSLASLTSTSFGGGTLGTSASIVFYVGGSIPLTPTTATGTYTGTLTVTTAYN